MFILITFICIIIIKKKKMIVGRIIATTLGEENYYNSNYNYNYYFSDVSTNWQMTSNDGYLDGLFEFGNVPFDNNRLNQEIHNYMFVFIYNRIKMYDTVFNDNNYDSGCIRMKDTLINVTDTEFNDNSGNTIISIVHSKEAFITGDILSPNVDISDISLNGGISNTFIYLANITNDDQVNIQNSEFDSPFSEYILYATSKLDTTDTTTFNFNSTLVADDETADLTYIEIYNNIFHNCSKSAIMWTSSDNKYNDSIYSKYGDFDGNNGNLGLMLLITNNTFKSSVLNGIFGTETNSPDGENNIYFVIIYLKIKN